MAIGLSAALPCVVLPALLLPRSDRGKVWHQRHWVKANLWIAIFSFIGNYFWTHYFYEVLGASYTFPSWRLNNVGPFLCPLCDLPASLCLKPCLKHCQCQGRGEAARAIVDPQRM